MSAKKKSIPAPKVYKTEEQMKAEAREKIKQERLELQNRKPKSAFETTIENFWYHNKAVTLGGLAAFAIIAFFAWDMIFTVRPDITVMMITSQFYPVELQDELKEEMQKYATDINGDGRVIVQIDHIPFAAAPLTEEEYLAGDYMDSEENQNISQEEYAYVMKIMATVSAGQEQVYLLDKPNYLYIAGMDESDLFLKLDSASGSEGDALPLINTKLSSLPNSRYYEGLSFYLRDLRITDKNAALLEGNEAFIKSLVS